MRAFVEGGPLSTTLTVICALFRIQIYTWWLRLTLWTRKRMRTFVLADPMRTAFIAETLFFGPGPEGEQSTHRKCQNYKLHALKVSTNFKPNCNKIDLLIFTEIAAANFEFFRKRIVAKSKLRHGHATQIGRRNRISFFGF